MDSNTRFSFFRIARSAALASVASAAAAVACGGEDSGYHPPSIPGAGGAGGVGQGGTANGAGLDGGGDAGASGAAGYAGTGSNAGAGGGGTGGFGANAGSGGLGGAGGSGGVGGGSGFGGFGGVPVNCGNQTLDPPFEACDGTEFGGVTCKTLGFDSGTLKCRTDCSVDTSGCLGNENCWDGLDNDADGKPDCSDSDCTTACGDPCASPQVLSDPSSVWGSTLTHISKTDASCSNTPSGGEIIYTFTATKSGVVEAVLTSTTNHTLSIRSTCGTVSTEAGCTTGKKLVIPATQGSKWFIVVDPATPGDLGTYALAVQSRSVGCGDKVRDPSEQCDDGNVASGDGCSSTCKVESDEVESNDEVQYASNFKQPFHAQITPAGDLDWVRFQSYKYGSVTIQTLDYGDGACSQFLEDTKLSLYEWDTFNTQANLLTYDDDTGLGGCSKITYNVQPGTYYVLVQASPLGSTPTFPYILDIQGL